MGKKYKKLTIGIPREKQQIEQRVSLTPEAVEVLVNNGHEVLLESKAGEGARYNDNDYSECGAFIIENRKQVLACRYHSKGISPRNQGNRNVKGQPGDPFICSSWPGRPKNISVV